MRLQHVKGKMAVSYIFEYLRIRDRKQKCAEASSSTTCAEEQKFASLESCVAVKKGMQSLMQKLKIHLALTCHLQT